MANYIRVVGVPHHNSEHFHMRLPIIELHNGQDPEYEALVGLWRAGGVTDNLEFETPPTREQFEEAKQNGAAAIPLGLTKDTNFGEGDLAVLWYETNGEGAPNIGFNVSADGTVDGIEDKYLGTWVKVEPWQPNQERLTQLLNLSKQALALRVLQLEVAV